MHLVFLLIFYINLFFNTYYCTQKYSPRILITIDSENSLLSVNEIAQKLECHTIPSNEIDILKTQINDLDKRSNNHRVIIDGSFEKIKLLARKCGYSFIEITQKTIEEAIAAIFEKEATIPVTDDCFQKITAEDAGLLYHLMKKVDDILKKYNLNYWIGSGTLLGAVRHHGLIPWDDDLDIYMFEHETESLLRLKDALDEQGLKIVIHPDGFYKICFTYGQKILISEAFQPEYLNQEYFDWTFPFLDIFPMQLNDENLIIHTGEKKEWDYDYFSLDELTQPFHNLKFGPLYLPAPLHYQNILNRLYGNDWNDIAYCQWDHKNETPMPKIKVALTDRSSVPYVLPKE